MCTITAYNAGSCQPASFCFLPLIHLAHIAREDGHRKVVRIVHNFDDRGKKNRGGKSGAMARHILLDVL